MNGIDVSNSCHEDVMTILQNQAKQPVQVEILTKEDDDKKLDQKNKSISSEKPTNSSRSTITSDKQANKIEKIDKQVQTDSRWLDDLIYEHFMKFQLDLNEINSINKNSDYKESDSDDFYEILDYSDNYLDGLDDDFIDENCNAFEYKV